MPGVNIFKCPYQFDFEKFMATIKKKKKNTLLQIVIYYN